MDSPTAWNVNDKYGPLIVNSDGLRVDYIGEDIDIGMSYSCKNFTLLYFIL